MLFRNQHSGPDFSILQDPHACEGADLLIVNGNIWTADDEVYPSGSLTD